MTWQFRGHAKEFCQDTWHHRMRAAEAEAEAARFVLSGASLPSPAHPPPSSPPIPPRLCCNFFFPLSDPPPPPLTMMPISPSLILLALSFSLLLRLLRRLRRRRLSAHIGAAEVAVAPQPRSGVFSGVIAGAVTPHRAFARLAACYGPLELSVTTVVASSPADGDALEVEPGGVVNAVEAKVEEGEAGAVGGEGEEGPGAGRRPHRRQLLGQLEAPKPAGGYFVIVTVVMVGKAAFVAGSLRGEAYRRAAARSAPRWEALLIFRGEALLISRGSTWRCGGTCEAGYDRTRPRSWRRPQAGPAMMMSWEPSRQLMHIDESSIAHELFVLGDVSTAGGQEGMKPIYGITAAEEKAKREKVDKATAGTTAKGRAVA
uniref:Uncharacterized protein n=1 Tax=Ananas comosus var. bracteatus TaxID=296719 RepID=A0A6V7PUC3_ANACO|nr:unnamed protein product [Ananas comosus var. bracteatus]